MLLFPDLEWKIIYVGAAESEEYDQTLDSVLVGPVPAGKHMFVFQVSTLFQLFQCHYPPSSLIRFTLWTFGRC